MMRECGCSTCSNRFNYKDDGSGDSIKCPRCGAFCYFVHRKDEEPVHVEPVKDVGGGLENDSETSNSN